MPPVRALSEQSPGPIIEVREQGAVSKLIVPWVQEALAAGKYISLSAVHDALRHETKGKAEINHQHSIFPEIIAVASPFGRRLRQEMKRPQDHFLLTTRGHLVSKDQAPIIVNMLTPDDEALRSSRLEQLHAAREVDQQTWRASLETYMKSEAKDATGFLLALGYYHKVDGLAGLLRKVYEKQNEGREVTPEGFRKFESSFKSRMGRGTLTPKEACALKEQCDLSNPVLEQKFDEFMGGTVRGTDDAVTKAARRTPSRPREI